MSKQEGVKRHTPAAQDDGPGRGVDGALVIVHRGVGHLELRAHSGQRNGMRPLVAPAAVSLPLVSHYFTSNGYENSISF